MFQPDTYKARRAELSNKMANKGIILIAGNNDTPINYPGNIFRYRQDSNFLYFVGIDMPGLMATIDTATGETTLYGNDIPVESAIWTGVLPKLSSWAEKSGISKLKSFSSLATDLKAAHQVHYLPPYRHDRKIYLSEVFGLSVQEIQNGVSEELIKAIVNIRSYKSDEEVAQIEDALNRATAKFHVEAMKMALPGAYEYQIAGQIESTMLKNLCTSAYGIICSIHGEILHNVTYDNKLEEGRMLLIDAGAENPMHYASDITRTTPVGGKFNTQQKAVYNIVLKALNSAISLIKPGVTYQSIHFEAAKIMTQGMIELGIMKGDVDEIVAKGAHALFFPHGLGHMIGLDVHDMEDLGEDYVGYNEITKRSEIFGTAYLRLGRELEPGFVLTSEPGLYFIPILIEQWRREKKFTEFINYNALDSYMNFGGIRLEDNILVTADGRKVLGNPIPKSVSDVEGLF